VAIRAQDTALLNFGYQIGQAAEVGDNCYFTPLVPQVVKVKHNWVRFSAQDARMLAQVLVHVRAVSMLTCQATTRRFGTFVIRRSTLRKRREYEPLAAQ
jgi:hypothetical protein